MAAVIPALLIFGLGWAVLKIGATRLGWGLAGYYIGRKRGRAHGK